MKNNDLQLEEVRQHLLERKTDLEQELERLGREKFSDDQVQDAGDQALSSTMEAVKTSFQNAKRKELGMITKALEMIKEGTYGVCEDCGLPISPRRLKLFPNAARCLACQEVFEEGTD